MVIKEDQFAKLAALKQEMDPEGKEIYMDFTNQTESEDNTVSDAEEKKIQEQFIREFQEQAVEEDPFEMEDYMDTLTGPAIEEQKVEVSYSGGVIKKYVDISVVDLAEKVTEEQFNLIVDTLKQFSKEKSKERRSMLLFTIAQQGEEAVSVIFQKCRIFELVSAETKMEIVQLIAKLSRQNLDNRLLVKGILDYSTSESHILLAIKVAGALNDKEMARPIEKYLMQEKYFLAAYNALLKMRSTESVPIVIQAINQIDSTSRNLIEDAVRSSKNFYLFGLEAFDKLFEAYANCMNSVIRPIYIFAIRSYGDQGLPKLIELSTKLTDDKLYQIFKTIGGLRTQASSDALKALLNNVEPRQKANVIAGISSTGDEQFVDIVLFELKHSDSTFYSSKCLQALANIGGRNNEIARKQLEPYVKHKEGNLHVDALNCLVRLGDTKRFDDLLKLALYGVENEKTIALKAISLLPMHLTERLVERLKISSDEDTFTLVTTLQSKNRLPRKTGEILEAKLKQPIPEFLRIEIYRLISRHEGTANRVLPDGYILRALELEEKKSDGSRITRELRKMVKNKKESISVLKV